MPTANEESNLEPLLYPRFSRMVGHERDLDRPLTDEECEAFVQEAINDVHVQLNLHLYDAWIRTMLLSALAGMRECDRPLLSKRRATAEAPPTAPPPTVYEHLLDDDPV